MAVHHSSCTNHRLCSESDSWTCSELTHDELEESCAQGECLGHGNWGLGTFAEPDITEAVVEALGYPTRGVLVLENTYPACHRATAADVPDFGEHVRPIVVFILRGGRALGASDMASVLGLGPDLTLTDPAIRDLERARDAGLSSVRKPRAIRAFLNTLT